MAGNGGLYCLGCGENLVGKKPYERRVLYTLQGKKVKDSWKELLTSTGTVSVVLDQLIGTEENPQFMCRSCFEKYKTLAKLRTWSFISATRGLTTNTIDWPVTPLTLSNTGGRA